MRPPPLSPLEWLCAELSDEAAAEIAELLTQLALWFENTHYAQIQRHYESMRPAPDHDLNQLELFEPF
jgi:hypothetical protein